MFTLRALQQCLGALCEFVQAFDEKIALVAEGCAETAAPDAHHAEQFGQGARLLTLVPEQGEGLVARDGAVELKWANHAEFCIDPYITTSAPRPKMPRGRAYKGRAAGGGDITRMVGVGRDGMTAGCLNINRGKRGMPLDIDSPAGLEAVHKLVATADVFVRTLRPPAATHLGMGVDAVRVIRPDIVYFIAGAMSDT